MHEIVLGDTTIVSAEATRSQPQGPSSSVRHEATFVSLAQAGVLAGHRILQPTYLPSPSLALDRVGVLAMPSGPSREVTLTFLRYSETPFQWLVLHQSPLSGRGPEHNRRFVSAALREGRIGERPAAIFDHLVPATEAPGGQITITHCLWEHGRFLMDLQAPHLSLAELTRVGASLA